MHDDLSVKENLTMYAGLRLPATLNRQQRLAVVKDVMAVLEIDRIAHSVLTHNLSNVGFEKKSSLRIQR